MKLQEIQEALDEKNAAEARLRQYERLKFDRDRLKDMLAQPKPTAEGDVRVLRQLIELTQRLSTDAYTANVPRRSEQELVEEFGESLGKTLFEVSRDMRGYPSLMQVRALVFGALFTALERSKRLANEFNARQEELTAQLAQAELALEQFQQ